MTIEWTHLREEAAVPRGVTVGTPRWKHAVSLDARGKGLVHRVDRVLLNWREGRLSARWACTSGRDGALNAALVRSDSATCDRCASIETAEALGAPPGAVCVYYARRADGLIKIGHSANVGLRVAALRAELLAVEPSWGVGREGELARHFSFRFQRQEGEWFLPSQRLLEHIENVRQGSPQPPVRNQDSALNELMYFMSDDIEPGCETSSDYTEAKKLFRRTLLVVS